MDILMQSVLTQAQRLRLSLHLRYLDRQPAVPMSPQAGEGVERPGVGRVTSVVIIRQPYRYLEPVVRAMCKEAPDVEVLLDRRWRDRRAAGAPFDGMERRGRPDRRGSAPMLDILIDVQS